MGAAPRSFGSREAWMLIHPYECFAHVAGETGAQVIAVAHHRDDNCETILHHLFRGSSLKGLGGMDPRRKMGDFSVIRPFLETGRQEIESWLKERDIVWRTDETNLEDDYTRNRMRQSTFCSD